MRVQIFLLATLAATTWSFAACNVTSRNSNGYTEVQAREERARAKENKETIGESLDDARIHAQIVAKLRKDRRDVAREIYVDVVNGEVTLRGTVRDGKVNEDEDKAEAERLAKETEGVKKVVNQLTTWGHIDLEPSPSP